MSGYPRMLFRKNMSYIWLLLSFRIISQLKVMLVLTLTFMKMQITLHCTLKVRKFQNEIVLYFILPPPLPPPTACWNGILCGLSWESKCNIQINVWAQFYKILLDFEVPYQPRVKELKLPKVGKGCFKPSFFLWFTHWWNCLSETDWLGVGKNIKEIVKFYKNELRL